MASFTTFKIHPSIGIARLGDSPDDFYLAPEQTGALPIECDAEGKTTLGPDGKEVPIKLFRDSAGRVRRQAARFRIYVYDTTSPEGREVKIGQSLQVINQNSGATYVGKVTDVLWTAYLANKKASWYEFRALDGEHGYSDTHPLRNADVKHNNQRQQLIIDPGPQTVGLVAPAAPTAEFARGKNPGVPQSFPPPLRPNNIDTLGELKVCAQDGSSRLIVLGGHGNSGSYLQGFGEPVIRHYANNDGWFDDVSDGPITAQLLFTIDTVDGQKPIGATTTTINVDDPAWVIVGYPRFAPQIVDMVTMDDVVYDVAIRQFAYDPEIFGHGIPVPTTPEDLATWRRTARWNNNYYPRFWRDIWPILLRPPGFANVMDFDSLTGGDPHNNTPGGRGNLDPDVLSIPPIHGEDPVAARQRAAQRAFIYSILRKPGQENLFTVPHPRSASSHLVLMPFLCGDNPLYNHVASKFLRLTDTQLFLLKQWAEGKFINEREEKFIDSSPQSAAPTGAELDRGVLGNLLGGAFCPGGETCWIIRNPAIFAKAYRIKVSPAYLPAKPNFIPGSLSLTSNLKNGLEPGDITKYSGLPWQSDFNECSTQHTDITYPEWNKINPKNIGDPTAPILQLTYWWPAHRPMMVSPPNSGQVVWSNGIPQDKIGDLMMVTAWKTLGFIKDNVLVEAQNQN